MNLRQAQTSESLLRPADLVAGAVQRNRVHRRAPGPASTSRCIDLATREVRQLTFGEGTNESPAFSPNGRHIVFTSTRAGKTQMFTIARDGKDVRQMTRIRQQRTSRTGGQMTTEIDDEWRDGLQ